MAQASWGKELNKEDRRPIPYFKLKAHYFKKLNAAVFLCRDVEVITIPKWTYSTSLMECVDGEARTRQQMPAHPDGTLETEIALERSQEAERSRQTATK